MRLRSIRIAFVVLYVGGLIAAGYNFTQLEDERSGTASAHQSFDSLSDEAGASIATLKAAQQAYVAAGQGIQYRMEQAAASLETLSTQLVGLKRLTLGQTSATAVGAAAQTMDSFVELDERVREYAANGQVLMASDIIFTDGVEMLDSARGSLEAARVAERSHADATIAALSQRQATLLAGTAGASLLVVAFLFVTGLRPTAKESSDTAGTREADATVQGLGLELSVAAVSSTPGDRPAESTETDRPASTPAMEEIATLCCDLARVQDANDLPDLLSRAARLLDATGVIVWLTAPGGGRLLPALTHGYDEAVVRRMGTIPRDADNATASAYRDAELRTVAAEGGSSAAIVSPLVAGHGCVGAMALEVAAGAETETTRHSLLSIVATQLAVLVSETPAAPGGESLPDHAKTGSG